MAGDANAGGGGSVYWTVDVDNVDDNSQDTRCENPGQGHYHQRGKDQDGLVNVDFFTVSIRIPDGFVNRQGDYLNDLRNALAVDAAGERVSFPLRIENHRDQININWGGRHVARRGRGIQVMAHVAATKGLAKRAGKKAKAGARAGKKKAAKKTAAKKKR